MSLQSTGTATDAVLLFNTAILTINGVDVTEVSNVTSNVSFDVKETRPLNTIKATKNRRSNLTVEVTFEVDAGMYKELVRTFFGASSTVASGSQFTIKDGQQLSSSVYITGYENDNTGATTTTQYQLVNPILAQHNDTRASQEFGTVGVTINCTDIELFMGSATVG